MSTFSLKQAGDWLKASQGDIAIVIGFILIALISFGAGRLTAPQTVRNPIIFEEPSPSPSGQIQNQGAVADPFRGEKGMFVASKSGKKFHWPWCSYGKNIKESNHVWFETESQAKAAGFSPCACISSSAPAGYVAK